MSEEERQEPTEEQQAEAERRRAEYQRQLDEDRRRREEMFRQQDAWRRNRESQREQVQQMNMAQFNTNRSVPLNLPKSDTSDRADEKHTFNYASTTHRSFAKQEPKSKRETDWNKVLQETPKKSFFVDIRKIENNPGPFAQKRSSFQRLD